jgi:3-hydroxyisobutyrate dehydrogenase-like beta-hydroxyacid dehydrogenase
MATVGLINPGEMGASVGAAACAGGARVLWASAGRGQATRERASRSGLVDCGTTNALVRQCDFILSICPPHAAHDVAAEVACLGFTGIYLEGNAISPGHTRAIETIIVDGGATFVDGGIIGGPVSPTASPTVLHLSGPASAAVAALFIGSPLQTRIVSDQIGAASALKMAFAAYSKGSTALLSAILAVAEAEGVRSQLEQQWGARFTEETHTRVSSNTAKAWRFSGEMEEIAATFAGAGLADGFHRAAADTFRRLSTFKDRPAPDIETVIQQLLRR